MFESSLIIDVELMIYDAECGGPIDECKCGSIPCLSALLYSVHAVPLSRTNVISRPLASALQKPFPCAHAESECTFIAKFRSEAERIVYGIKLGSRPLD